MVSLAPWAWPLCAALALGAWQVWPRAQGSLALGSLALALLSAWMPPAGLALACAGLALYLGAQLEERWDWLGAVGLPLLFAGLLRARLAWLPVLPGEMAFWAGLLALVAVCIACQGLLVSQELAGAQRSLLASQTAWCAFALVTGSPQVPIAFVGLLGLLWQQALLRLPLQAVLRRQPPPAVLTAFLFLGLGGCLGLSGFSAYFQLFIPLMGQGDGVATMQAKLFSGAGLLAAVAMLAVLVQTCAFGYFYWLQVLPQTQAEDPRPPWPQRVWPWVALGLSLAWGLHHYPVSQQAIQALHAIGLPDLTPSS
jgi:hypothetical protein